MQAIRVTMIMANDSKIMQEFAGNANEYFDRLSFVF